MQTWYAVTIFGVKCYELLPITESFGRNTSRAVRTLRVGWEDRFTLYRGLLGGCVVNNSGPLGGAGPQNFNLQKAAIYPSAPWLSCTDVTVVRSEGDPGIDGDGIIVPQIAVVNAVYTPIVYDPVYPDTELGPFSMELKEEEIAVGDGDLSWINDDNSIVSANTSQGPSIQVSIQDFTQEVRSLPVLATQNYMAAIGCVNLYTFMNMDQGTVKYGGMTTRQRWSPFGNPLFDAPIHFLYRQVQGSSLDWNYFYRPLVQGVPTSGGKWEQLWNVWKAYNLPYTTLDDGTKFWYISLSPLIGYPDGSAYVDLGGTPHLYATVQYPYADFSSIFQISSFNGWNGQYSNGDSSGGLGG